MMMMGAGFIILFVLILIGIPLLLVVMLTGSGLASLFGSHTSQSKPNPLSRVPAEMVYARKCPTCGRVVKADWNVCPSCGAALT